ncbi:MAG: type IX secretion system periplasmic lipoprotein PorW/SprE, partial [Flavisolibacter sp.]
KPYEERVLRAEKATDKPLKGPGKFFQNLTTHYNYYFNASTKLNEVIDQAKLSFRDDYTLLLPFYNYSLETTSQSIVELDSVIYKAQTAIVLHDLRNDWVDNMYLLWGAAYFFEKKFDSAALMFQFINHSFAEKEKDGYYRYIGSRMDGNNALSVSTKEDAKFPKNTVTPPSRNNSLIWRIRSLIELGNMAEVGSLISTLKYDPLFPERLEDDLEEVQAYWFYKQNIWDSSANHLLKALSQTKNKQEKARWEYLAAQMMERSGKFEEAQKLYEKSISHTTDPVMEVYARLNMVRINKDTTDNYIDRNIAELVKMARRDKYVDYRDIIYYMAAQMELERNNPIAAQDLLLKSAKYNNGNLGSRNKSFLLIADLSYNQKKYEQAAAFYDSVQVADIEDPLELSKVEERKTILSKIISFSKTISKEDSLQRLAAMPEEERTAYINKLVKQLRKVQGLDDVVSTSGNPSMGNNSSSNLFPSNQAKGEWYFYNNNLKTQGASQFKQNWGNRPNSDNWRRYADITQQLLAKTPENTRNPGKNPNNITTDITPTYTSLLSNVPLTPALMEASNDSIRTALYELGLVYMNEAEDYSSAIETFEELRKRFPSFDQMNVVLFHLYYAYQKTGDATRAAEIKKLLEQKFPESRLTTIVTTGKDPVSSLSQNNEVTKIYEGIYDLFISGKFEEAQAEKLRADSVYQTNYWQPQLLYIEAVYQIRQRNDSIAKNSLQTIISQDPEAPMAIKAQTMIDVLNRRHEIEAELSRYQIVTPKQDSVVKDVVINIPPIKKDTIVTAPKHDMVITLPKQIVDTIAKKPIVQAKPSSVYKFDAGMKHYAMIILDKVDPLFVNEV